MSQVSQVADLNIIDRHQVDGVLPHLEPLFAIVKGADAIGEYPGDLVFPGAAEHLGIAPDATGEAMLGVLVTYGDDVGGDLARVIPRGLIKGVGDHGGCFTLQSKAGMAQPCYIHFFSQ